MSRLTSKPILALSGFAALLVGANREFYNIAEGSGTVLSAFAPTWLAFFALFFLITLLALVAFGFYLFNPAPFLKYKNFAVRLRARLGRARWALALLAWLFPIYFLQYTAWGAVFHGIFIRLLLAALSVALMTWLFAGGDELAAQNPFWAALILASFGFVAALSFSDVNSYPFSQSWSEGNRLWDYSLLFGKERYALAEGKNAKAYLELGRQLVGAIPFLYSGLTIEMERAWLALMTVIPYLLAGAALFLRGDFSAPAWLAVLWTFLFLKQGPIHPPLLFVAAGTALLWRKPLWLALPLIFIIGYYARLSRSTWVFAPGIWIFILEFAGAAWQDKKSTLRSAYRAAALGLMGVLGGQYGAPLLLLLSQQTLNVSPSIKLSAALQYTQTQPLLWERLLPNATYSAGILLGICLAAAPLAFVLICFAARKIWTLRLWQRVGLFAPLAAFLAVGLIVSVKIGGGGDLHNMDMFLIALTFTAALAWHGGGRGWLLSAQGKNPRVSWGIALLLALPAFSALQTMRPQNFIEQADWLLVLSDAPDKQALNMLPAQKDIEEALQTIQDEVDEAQKRGEVLFMDQRQLLTFGYVHNSPFVPEYEKKVLINEALSSNVPYFQAFYADLAAGRFSLIIAPPQRRVIQDEEFVFGDENNAWTKWVSTPVLCYYERKMTLREVGVQLLYPIAPTPDCASEFPAEMQRLNKP